MVVQLWLRNEVFEGVLPLRTMGSVHGMANQLPASSDAAIMTTLASLAEALRCQHPTMVAYTTWVAEGWRVLHWQLKQTTLFWEMLLLYTKDNNSVEQDSSGGGEKLRRGPTQVMTALNSQYITHSFE
eukprot:TRINITY_DN11473_c0_g1_i1.p1 TRINITY_DN11473_c0_g1~~TRINITY_DN11473_c0_g1_i1.p1  ORF type:complete len:128 (-),score=19.12 TRINITY_DN11473_c0_g1_i1:306-689(-)